VVGNGIKAAERAGKAQGGVLERCCFAWVLPALLRALSCKKAGGTGGIRLPHNRDRCSDKSPEEARELTEGPRQALTQDEIEEDWRSAVFVHGPKIWGVILNLDPEAPCAPPMPSLCPTVFKYIEHSLQRVAHPRTSDLVEMDALLGTQPSSGNQGP